MLIDNQLIFQKLIDTFGIDRIRSVYRTFENCSKEKNRKDYLVSNKTKAINFDSLTSWLYEEDKPKSADSMTFGKDCIYLIEFKAGNYMVEGTRNRILKSVEGKIIDSENTIFDKIVLPVESIKTESVRLKFYVVIPLLDAGIEPYISIFANKSLGASNLSEKQQKMILGIDQISKELCGKDSHYEEIGLWYSDFFDDYIHKEGIIDISCYEKFINFQ